MQQNIQSRQIRIGILDHTGPSIGGGTMVAAHLASVLSRVHSVDLIRDWSGFNLQEISSAFSLELANVRAVRFDGIWESFAVPGRYSLQQQLERSRGLTAGYDLFVCAGHWIPPFCFAKHGLIYCHFPIDLPLDNRFFLGDARWRDRNRIDRWLRTTAYMLGWRARLNGYDRILANSAFTAGWIERRWGVHTDVVYPPIELEVPKSAKQNRIVSIGRFVAGERGKGHLDQVAAFRKFLRTISEPWELWMIGTCYPEADRTFLNAVQEAAHDLPVRFFVNVDRQKVLESLAEAKLFWHTAGLSENATNNPVFSEHFGMATVEAMRAGCVPVVISSGGQREIIKHEASGFLCKDVDELVMHSTAVTERGKYFAALSQQALSRSWDFSGDVFNKRISELITRIISTPTKHWGMRALNVFARLFNSSTQQRINEFAPRAIPDTFEDGAATKTLGAQRKTR